MKCLTMTFDSQRNTGVLGGDVSVRDHYWGREVTGLGGPFDFVLVAEFCYIDEVCLTCSAL